MIDFFFRCKTQEGWAKMAVARDLLVESLDEEGNAIYAPALDVSIDEIENIILVLAEYDYTDPDNPVLITPGIVDDWLSFNVRFFGGRAAEDAGDLYPGEQEDGFKFTRSNFARDFRNDGTDGQLRGKRVYEVGAGDDASQLIDPRDVVTPSREWSGGMVF